MKPGLVEMVFILDRSGSMSGLEQETIGGYNGLIEKQKKEPGEAFVTTVLFDNEYEMLLDHVPLADVPKMTDKEYYPRGTTALLDAIGRTVLSIGKRLSDTPEEERPSQVMVVITTDGYENASTEFTKAKIKEMVSHQQDKYNWIFMFLGANIDTMAEGGSMGMSGQMSKGYAYTSSGVNSVYASVSKSMAISRRFHATCDSLAGIEKDSAMDVEMKAQMSKALDEIEED